MKRAIGTFKNSGPEWQTTYHLLEASNRRTRWVAAGYQFWADALQPLPEK